MSTLPQTGATGELLSLRHPPRSLVLGLALTVVAIAALGYGYYRHQGQAAEQAAHAQIAAIGNLKADEIGRWLKERQGIANTLLASPLGMALSAALNDPGALEERDQALAWIWSLIGNYDYSAVVLLDADGRAVLSVPAVDMVLEPSTLAFVRRALSSARVVFSDLYDDHVYLIDSIVPLLAERDGDKRAIGAVLLRIDPQRFLFPLLKTWPTPSASGETVLVRRENSDIVYLNPLRHGPQTPLELRLPLDRPGLPAALALRGEQGEISGLDYRGVEVLAAVRRIAESPWYLVAKIDRAEIEAPVRAEAVRIGAVMGLLMLLACLAAWALWRRQIETAWRGLNRLLEQRVRERTAALLHSRQQLERQVAACQSAEAALVESEQRMRFALEAARMGVWEWDLLTDRCHWSTDVEQIHGLAPGTFAGTFRAYLHCLQPQDRERVQQALARAARHGGECDLQYRALWPDGTLHWIEAKGRTRCEASGRAVHMTGLCRDITQRKQTEELAQHLQTELEHMDRLSVAGQMVAVLAHELRQPLTIIHNSVQAAQFLLEAGRIAEATQSLKPALSQVANAGDIINRLRDFTRKSTPRSTAVDLNALIGEIATLVDIDARRRRVTLELDLHPDLPRVQADPVQIQQVLMNLMRNALDALDAAPRGERLLRVATAPAGGHGVAVVVADTGPGLAPEAAERLFQPFYTTKDSGTGLGLSISKSIVEAHGGRIWVTANPGGGAAFHFTLADEQAECDSTGEPADTGVTPVKRSNAA